MNKNASATKILLVALPVLFVASMLMLIYFKVEQIKAVATDLVTEQVSLQQENSRLEMLKKLKSNESEIKAQYEKILKMIPKEPMEDDLITGIQNTAALSGVDFVHIKFNPRELVGNYVDMPLEIGFSGGYKDFIKLTQSLRSGERALRMDSVTVSVTQEDMKKIRADIVAHSFCMDTGLLQQGQ
jgi:Tfp pilus assembly protein PilO